MSKEKPILFKDEMIRAILEGRKTQTRRVLDVPAGWFLESVHGEPCVLGKITSPHPKRDRFGAFIRKEIHPGSGKFQHDIVTCKHGGPGDRLWVRENFRLYFGGGHENVDGDSRERFESFELEFQADSAVAEDLNFLNGVPVEGTNQRINYEQISRLSESGHDGFRPSIHMPRWASRITLGITDVRVEQLQDISEEDAKAEGVRSGESLGGCPNYWHSIDGEKFAAARNAFCDLWQSINGPDSWDANPWVWVIEFKQVKP